MTIDKGAATVAWGVFSASDMGYEGFRLALEAYESAKHPNKHPEVANKINATFETMAGIFTIGDSTQNTVCECGMDLAGLFDTKGIKCVRCGKEPSTKTRDD